MFERIYHALEWVSRRAVWMGGAALLLAAVMVTLDVVSRKLFNVTMSGADEISGYVFAASTTWAYSYCLLHRANIRIDALYTFLPRRLCAVLDTLAVALLLLYNSVLAYRAWGAFSESWARDSVSITTLGTPQWIPQLFWASGLIFFEAVLLFVFLYTMAGLLRRDPDLVGRIAGVPSVAEEIEAETHGMTLPAGARKG